MKKMILAISAILSCLVSFSQYVCFAAARSGLSMREQPGTGAKVLEKIPYGEKLVTVPGDANQAAISTEGFNGFWWKVSYNGKTGYIVNSYVLPAPPPKTGIKTLKDYFAQVSTISGSPLTIKNSNPALNETGESTITKQLYRNGMEWQRTEGYENASELCLLPEFTIEQCFLLVRLLGQYPGLIAEKDLFPSKNSTTKSETGDKTIEVEREKYDGRSGPVNKIRIVSAEGAVTTFELFMLDTQAVIFWSSGV